jgi:hypothetical protein
MHVFPDGMPFLQAFVCIPGSAPPTPSGAHSPAPAHHPQDFDADGLGAPGLALSPAPPGAVAVVGGGGSNVMMAAPEPPKIRVLVRKRPLNRKVRLALLPSSLV